MHPSLYNYLRQNGDLLTFIRNNPIWYRYLTRDDIDLKKLNDAAKKWQGKTIPQRTEKIIRQAKMLHLLYELMKTNEN